MKVNHVVLDTNVLISALLSYQGAVRKTLDIVRNHGTLIFSEETFTELLSRLYRLKNLNPTSPTINAANT